MISGKMLTVFLFARLLVLAASSAHGDPGFLLRCGHQLRSDLGRLSLQPAKLQLPHQRAEQHRGHGVGEPNGDQMKFTGCPDVEDKVLSLSIPPV